MTVVADLHLHTTVTDGRARPEEVIARAARAGVRYAVITDHSAVVFDPSLRELAHAHGVTMPFPGVEISTHLDGRRYHVMAYGPAVDDPEFAAFIRPPLGWKVQTAEAARLLLLDDGHALPELDVIRRVSPDGDETPERLIVSRSAMARHVAAVSGMNFDNAYARVKNAYAAVEARDADRPEPQRLSQRYLPTLDVLAEATRRGITTAVSHPLWRCHDDADIEQVCVDLETLRTRGLEALETRSYHHRPLDDHPLLLRARDTLGLLPSGGSDYHANGKTEIGVGGLTAEAFEVLADLVERTARVSHV